MSSVSSGWLFGTRLLNFKKSTFAEGKPIRKFVWRTAGEQYKRISYNSSFTTVILVVWVCSKYRFTLKQNIGQVAKDTAEIDMYIFYLPGFVIMFWICDLHTRYLA